MDLENFPSDAFQPKPYTNPAYHISETQPATRSSENVVSAPTMEKIATMQYPPTSPLAYDERMATTKYPSTSPPAYDERMVTTQYPSTFPPAYDSIWFPQPMPITISANQEALPITQAPTSDSEMLLQEITADETEESATSGICGGVQCCIEIIECIACLAE